MALGYNEELAVSASGLPGSVLIGDSRMVGIPEFTYLPNPSMSEQELTAFLLTIKTDPPAQSYESIHLGRLAKELRPVAPETETLAHLQARLDAERKQAGLPRRVFIDRDGRICDSATFEAQRAELIREAQAAPSRAPTQSGIAATESARYSNPPATAQLAIDAPQPLVAATPQHIPQAIGTTLLRQGEPTVERSPDVYEKQFENVAGIIRIAAHGLELLNGPYTSYPAEKQAWVQTPNFALSIEWDLFRADEQLYGRTVRYFASHDMPMRRLIEATLLAYEGPQNSAAFIPVLCRSLQTVLAEAPHYSVRSRGRGQQVLVNG